MLSKIKLMAEKKFLVGQQELSTKTITYSTVLGKGAFAAVFKAKCDELPCAAKILHTIFLNDPGLKSLQECFYQECEYLRSIKHPNIVQYLGLCQEPSTNQPVLLMELMDQSLTSFLANSNAPLSSSVQLRLSHDITLALAHLHSIKIVHRDLSSNNILLIGPGRRAKVCDFGMSKVIDRSKSNYATPLTMVPGTVVYMPQEALGETPKYTEKLDCFSFGVLVIQIITRLFPNPLPRKKEVKLPQSPTGSVLMPVAETVCRKDHIDLISKTNPLLDIAIECLSLNMDERPPAQELCCRVENLRSTSPSEAIPPDQLSPVEVELDLESVDSNSEWRAEKRQLEEEIASLRLQNSELAENLAMADYEKKGAPLPSMPAKSVSSTALIQNWRTGPPAPDVVAKSSSAVMTNSMCLCLNHLYAYDVESDRWTQLLKVPYNIMGLHVAYNEKLGKLVAVRNTTVYVADAEQWTVQDRLGFIPWSILSYETYIIFLGSEGRVVIMEFSSNVLSVRSSIYIPPAFQFATAKICNGAAYLVGATSKQIWLNQVLRIPLDNFLVHCCLLS